MCLLDYIVFIVLTVILHSWVMNKYNSFPKKTPDYHDTEILKNQFSMQRKKCT